MKNFTHIIIAFLFFILGLFSLLDGWTDYIALIIFSLFITYIGSLIVCCAIKSKHSKEIFPLPDRTWALLVIVFLISSNVCNFGNLYIQSGEVREQSKVCSPVLTDKGDAIYFSAVTLTTLGYGDFVPVGRKSRRYVLYQLVSGVLLLLFIFPIIASRLSDLD